MLYSPENASLLGFYDFIVLLVFLVALLLSVKNWREQKSIFIASAIITLKIVLTADTLSLFVDVDSYSGTDYYLRWIQFDSLSIISIIIIHLLFRVRHSRMTSVIMYLLTVHVFLYLAMHVDIIENGNRTSWWLWDLYTPAFSIINLSIAFIIIINSIINMKNKQAVARRFAENVAIK